MNQYLMKIKFEPEPETFEMASPPNHYQSDVAVVHLNVVTVTIVVVADEPFLIHSMTIECKKSCRHLSMRHHFECAGHSLVIATAAWTSVRAKDVDPNENVEGLRCWLCCG